MKEIRTIVQNDSRLTEFQRKVYLALLDVPRGATISYKELGERIGCKSAQAIGQALKRNPFAPDVPCHRVIASDGSIGGFHGKRSGEMIDKKRKLLQEEATDSLRQQESSDLLQSFHTFNPKDGETSILKCFCQSKQDEPQYPFGRRADG